MSFNTEQTANIHPKCAPDCIKELAAQIVSRRLEVPAILLPESLKPISRVINSAAEVVLAMFAPLVSTIKANNLLQVLESPEQVEALILEIESRVEGRR